MTRTAAQAFEARAGNCLSLVIMTAAFARELGLQVRFQSAYLEEAYSRSNNLLLRSGHVNLSLGKSFFDSWGRHYENPLTIDFLPAEELRGLHTREISEQTVVAMFMNNRAVEALVDGRVDDAYAWAREAVRASPSFLGAQNTLGVVYLRRNYLRHAAVVFGHVLDHDANNKPALSNLARTFARQGRVDESLALYRRLAQLEPDPPFHFFNLGLAAMKRQDFDAARDLFAKEVARADYYPEFHFWLGLANFRLGDIERARKHLTLALENSASRKDRELYAAKLDWLRTHGLQH
jgi:Tfp pilus assembly protein PilF